MLTFAYERSEIVIPLARWFQEEGEFTRCFDMLLGVPPGRFQTIAYRKETMKQRMRHEKNATAVWKIVALHIRTPIPDDVCARDA